MSDDDAPVQPAGTYDNSYVRPHNPRSCRRKDCEQCQDIGEERYDQRTGHVR